jgi:hypothetical protein
MRARDPSRDMDDSELLLRKMDRRSLFSLVAFLCCNSSITAAIAQSVGPQGVLHADQGGRSGTD